MYKNLFIILAVLGLIACGGEQPAQISSAQSQPAQGQTVQTAPPEGNLPVVDNSSEESYKKSMQRVLESVPKEREEDFNVAHAMLIVEGSHMADEDATQEECLQYGAKIAAQVCNGKNYKQIIAYVDDMMNNTLKENLKETVKILQKNRHAMQDAQYAEPTLAKIKLSDLKLGMSELTVNVKNGTQEMLEGLIVIGIKDEKNSPVSTVRAFVLNYDEDPIAPNQTRASQIKLNSEMGWEPAQKERAEDFMWVILRADTPNTPKGERIIVNEQFAELFDEFKYFRTVYAELSDGQGQWRKIFNTENVVKGYFGGSHIKL